MKKLNKLIIALFVIIALTALFTVKANAATESNNITFDGEYYLNTNPDLKVVFGENYDAARNHFLTAGISEGRTGSPYFNVKYYLISNPDLQVAFGNNYESAYNHFISSGISEGRKSSQYFEITYYLDNNPDLRAAFGNNFMAAYNHYIDNGVAEGRQGSQYFNAEYYLINNADLRAAFGNNYKTAFKHYLENGLKEGRPGSPYFDAKYYLGNNADLQAAFGAINYLAAYNHYLENGISEGRPASQYFDVKFYLNNNADLKTAFGNNYKAATNHYFANGLKEGRDASKSLSIKCYLKQYPDLQAAFGRDYKAATNHYFINGIKEGRTGSHQYNKKTIDSTCTATGKNIYTCKSGDSSYEEVIPAKGHSFGAWRATNANDKNVPAGMNQIRTCTRCNYSEYRYVAPAESTLVKEISVVDGSLTGFTNKDIVVATIKSNTPNITLNNGFTLVKNITSTDGNASTATLKYVVGDNAGEYKIVLNAPTAGTYLITPSITGSQIKETVNGRQISVAVATSYHVTDIKVKVNNNVSASLKTYLESNPELFRVNKTSELEIEFYSGNTKLDESNSAVDARNITFTKNSIFAEDTSFYSTTTKLTWGADGKFTGTPAKINRFVIKTTGTVGAGEIHIKVDNSYYGEKDYEATININTSTVQQNGLFIGKNIYRANTEVTEPITFYASKNSSNFEDDNDPGVYYTPIEFGIADEDDVVDYLTWAEVEPLLSKNDDPDEYIMFIGLIKQGDGSYTPANSNEKIDAIGVGVDLRFEGAEVDANNAVNAGITIAHTLPNGTSISVKFTGTIGQ